MHVGDHSNRAGSSPAARSGCTPPEQPRAAELDVWGRAPPVLVRDRTRDDRAMVLIGTAEHEPAAAALGLPADGEHRWRVLGWHRKRALWPFADPETDAWLLDALQERNRPSKPPPAPFLTADKYGFAFVCGPATSGLAKQAGLKWNGERRLWTTDHRYMARHLWALADEFADGRLAAEFGAEAKPPYALGRPTLFFDEGRFVHTCTFDDKDATKGAGFRWDPTEKIWYSRQVPIALKLHADAEPRLRAVLERSTQGPPFAALARLSLVDFVEIVLPEPKDQPGIVAPERDREYLHVLPNGRFYATDPARAFKAGFQLDGRGRWITSDVEKAMALRDHADMAAERMMQERLSAKFAAEVTAVEAVGQASIPAPDGLHYLPYQVQGIQFAGARTATLLGDEMGLGKTVQALGLINLLRPPRTLIVCPAMLCLNWLREARRWLTGTLSACIFRSEPPPDALAPDSEAPEGAVVIVSYDILSKLPSQEWDLAVFDEAHYLKNPSARRTRAVLGANGIQAARRLFMTGTPIFNRPQDLWPILSASLPHIFHRASRFKELYAVADPRSIPPDKAENLTVLGEILHKTIMLRRLKTDVLNDLPPKTWQTVLMDVGEATAKTLASDEWAAKRRFDVAVAQGASFKERRSILAELAELRRRTAEAKLPAALEHVLSVIEQNEPMVVFAYHRSIAQSLAEGLAEAGVRAAVLDGSVAPVKRQKVVDAFQAGEGDALIATMDAAGVGLTLTRSAIIAFVELDWTPAKMRQAEDRLHRHGQRRPVTVQHLVVDGTIDAYIADLVQSKTDMAASTLGDDLVEIDRMLSEPAAASRG